MSCIFMNGSTYTHTYIPSNINIIHLLHQLHVPTPNYRGIMNHHLQP